MKLSPTARRILEDFAGAYPLSAHYKGGRRLRRANLGSLFPEMDSDVEVKEEVLDGVEELSRAGILSVRWKRFREGTDPEALYLEDPENMFRLLELPSPKGLQCSMIDFLRRRLAEYSTPAVSGPEQAPERREYRLCDALLAELEADQPLPVGDTETLRELLSLFRLSPGSIEGITLRGLSIRLFGDSKRLEALLPAADRLSRKHFGYPLSEKLDLRRSFPEASFSLFGQVAFDGDRTWECAGEILCLPLAELGRLQGVFPDSGSVLSIENKETFHVFTLRNRLRSPAERFSCILYSGGYPDRAVRFLIRHLSERGARMFHFGDLDPEGLLIFQDIDGIVASAGGKLLPLLMDHEIYGTYHRYGKPLSGVQRERLRRVTCPVMLPLAREMDRRNIGVEQEVIDPDRECWTVPGAKSAGVGE